ncbi:SURF1 family protein [Nocardiopsis sp. CT-R113]|uniref:SURF1-like protein n=1 Tax=Nocardiopsis codii TaxID=3065942 RepID=A0ABU7KA44_9ACTN|nr:SURF1 family protein [Nocardiopsis sp. CT-R113]MEE2039108.1 SURF1 family protein [Nocardiopsis sp. CT-R113]
MRSPLLSPRWLGIHLVALLVVLVCVAGTSWQFVRAFEPDREVITNPVEDLATARPVADLLEPGEYMHPESFANQAVEATGHYDTGAQLLVPRVVDGVSGHDVILPLVTADGSAVTVNRGWAEEGQDIPDAPGGEVTATGWLLPPVGAEGVVPVEVSEGQVERIAASVLVQEWNHPLYEGYVTLPAQDPATDSLVPVPPPEPPTEVKINWRSLSYTVQWAMFGVSAVVFWIILMRRELAEARSRRERASDGEGAEGQPAVAGS